MGGDQQVVPNQRREERPRTVLGEQAQLSLGDAPPGGAMRFTAEKDPMVALSKLGRKTTTPRQSLKIAGATGQQGQISRRERAQIKEAESRQLAIARARQPMASPAEQAQAHGADLRGLPASVAGQAITVQQITEGEQKRSRCHS